MSGTVDISSLALEVKSDGVAIASDRLKELTTQGGNAENSVSKLSKSTSDLSGYLKMAAEAFAAWKLAEYIKEVTLLAARYETLGVVMKVVGNNAGYTGAQMAVFQKGLQQTGISAVEARQGLVLMGQAQVDMAKSAQLARVAQDAAVIANTNSSEAFNRMMTGISTGQAIILHHMGLMVNFVKAEQDLAASLGKTKEELTNQEMTQARVNEVMRVSIGISGSYEAAMGTTGKALTSIKRFSDDLKVSLGEAFGPALTTLVDELTRALKDANEQIKNNKSGVSTFGSDLNKLTSGTLNVFKNDLSRINALLFDMASGLYLLAAVAETPGRIFGNDLYNKTMAQSKAYADLAANTRAYAEAAQAAANVKGPVLDASEQGRANVMKDDAENKRIAAGAKLRAEAAAEAARAAAEKAAQEAQELAERQARYDQQLSDARESLAKQMDANQKQRDMATLQQKIAILDQEKAAGLKTAEEYLDGRYALERAEMQKELDASNALADQRYEAYLKVSKDPGADRTMQIKAEEEYRKQVGESLKIVEKMDAATRKKVDDNAVLAQERINTIIQRQNQQYQEQLAVRNQLRQIDDANAANAANMVGVNASTGTIDSVADQLAHDLAVQRAAHEQRLRMIQDEKDANYSAMMSGQRAWEDYDKVRRAKDKETAIEQQDNANRTAAITQKAYKSQTAMVGQYVGLASDLFAGLASAQDQSTRKGFENAKALNVASAIMATASAIMQQLAGPDGWTPMAWARSGVAAALGAIQVAKIASTSFGGGGSVSSTVSGGSFGGSGAASGGSVGAPVKSLTETKTEESLRMLAQSANSASLAVAKVADGLTKISQLFETGYGKNFSKGLGTEGAQDGNSASGLGSMAAIGGIGALGNMGFGWGNGWYTKDRGMALGLSGGEVGGDYYTERKKDGGWFTSSKDKMEYSTLDEGVKSTLASYTDQIKAAISNAAVVLGTSTDYSKANVSTRNISTAGRSAEDIQKDMEAFFADVSNSLAKTTKGLSDFAFYGEDAFDALIRLSTSLQGVNELFEKTGKALVSSTLEGANSAWKLVDAFGGLDKMASAVDDYFKGMFTDQEQAAMKAAQEQRQVTYSFKEMGIAIPQTNAEFINLVNSIDITTDKGATLYKSLMDTAPAFADLTKYIDDLKKAQMDLNGSSVVRFLNAIGDTNTAKIIDLQISQEKELADARAQGLNVAELVKAQAAEMAQAQIDIAFNTVKTAISKAQEAQQAAYAIQVKAAQEYVSKISATASTLKSAFDGVLSQQGETLQSRKLSEVQIHWYASRGKLPMNGELDNALKSVSQPSDQMFGDYTAYRRDYLKTLADIKTLNDKAQGQLTDAQKQLTAIETANDIATKGFAAQLAKAQAQIDAIHGTTTAVQSVTASMANLARVIQSARPAFDTSKTDKEIAALRSDLKAANVESVAAQKKMARILERWEDDGMPETRAA